MAEHTESSTAEPNDSTDRETKAGNELPPCPPGMVRAPGDDTCHPKDGGKTGVGATRKAQATES